MLFMTLVRWEAARFALDALARLVTFDAKPTAADRTRGQHYRNGVGALLSFTSDVALPGNWIGSGWRAAQNPARSELKYGVSQLRAAGVVGSARRFARRSAPVLLLGTCAVLLLHARADRD
jgi:hypothetical protein